ncbi:hypothetical protein VHUM_00940 [Vanrija humicola]|uniref:Uncharacterized protein n=1 Tax=Vanrija humicola TaxID=5417 RepID=A0A7D8Z6T2_VANHU|nr:hypothetical protein VHUM_00940 [Vanrija humicola]
MRRRPRRTSRTCSESSARSGTCPWRLTGERVMSWATRSSSTRTRSRPRRRSRRRTAPSSWRRRLAPTLPLPRDQEAEHAAHREVDAGAVVATARCLPAVDERCVLSAVRRSDAVYA